VAVRTWELEVGETFEGPPTQLDEDAMRRLIEIGGYTHPLFADPAYAAASVFGRSPVPGAGLLLLMGGMAERSERFDEDTIALIGYDRVRFRSAAFPGDVVRLRIEVVGKEPGTGRGQMTFEMTCLNQHDETLVEATARFLLRLEES
jgi:acyl dehydratase